MDVTETQQITAARTMEKVVVHPLVLRNIVDNYNRVAEKSGKRLVGVLLGESSGGIVEVVNSYHVPFKEDDNDWFLDHRHHSAMLQRFDGINDMVGWYSTGSELRENDLDVHAQFCSYAPNPVLVVIDVGLGIPTNAYYTKSNPNLEASLQKIEEKVFVRASVEIAPEAKDFADEYLLSELKDARPPKRLTLGGVSYVDAMESYLEFYKKQVRISVEGYDMSLLAPDLYISLENHFSSCGTVEFVEVPRDPVTKAISGRSSTVALRGEGAEEKALALNGSDLGGWRASVKILPPALASLRSGLTTREAARQYIAHFKRNK
ncbi:26S proteasome non-ATPase regulatory subunit 7 homolog A-like [Raphanus sativus]|uniref:26S proteasome non-ATPase regulatory subunit 7 homolog A-like n=1 Tax=Raphanus sativus TaxID=3726 RepID=A0A9W3CQA6_RAPSA|nr:26S proteasome non-ATPase regulatory subunit 7 homolog A-like [Raphanus sativus]